MPRSGGSLGARARWDWKGVNDRTSDDGPRSRAARRDEHDSTRRAGFARSALAHHSARGGDGVIEAEAPAAEIASGAREIGSDFGPKRGVRIGSDARERPGKRACPQQRDCEAAAGRGDVVRERVAQRREPKPGCGERLSLKTSAPAPMATANGAACPIRRWSAVFFRELGEGNDAVHGGDLDSPPRTARCDRTPLLPRCATPSPSPARSARRGR